MTKLTTISKKKYGVALYLLSLQNKTDRIARKLFAHNILGIRSPISCLLGLLVGLKPSQDDNNMFEVVT